MYNRWSVPLNTIDKDGNVYLDNTSKDICQKENGEWKVMSNLQGKDVKQKWDVDNELKILAIGNSFSDDALWLLPDILKSLGITKFRISNLYLPGCLLERHLSNIQNDSAVYEFRTNTGDGWNTVYNTKLSDGVKADDWDYITFQQGSPKSGLPESYLDLIKILDAVEAIKPNAKLAWHMTWAYQQDYSSSAFTENYGGNQSTMYNAIVNSVKSHILNNFDINFIIPNGTVVQNARTSFLRDTITRDGFHMSYDIGRYMTALTYAYLMTGYSLDDVAFKPTSISDDIKRVCIESVKNAIMNPCTITKSIYTENTNEA